MSSSQATVVDVVAAVNGGTLLSAKPTAMSPTRTGRGLLVREASLARAYAANPATAVATTTAPTGT